MTEIQITKFSNAPTTNVEYPVFQFEAVEGSARKVPNPQAKAVAVIAMTENQRRLTSQITDLIVTGSSPKGVCAVRLGIGASYTDGCVHVPRKIGPNGLKVPGTGTSRVTKIRTRMVEIELADGTITRDYEIVRRMLPGDEPGKPTGPVERDPILTTFDPRDQRDMNYIVTVICDKAVEALHEAQKDIAIDSAVDADEAFVD